MALFFPDKNDKSVQKLKMYVGKCGIRKVWKKELDGLSQKQAISRLKKILADAGIEGRPSLSQCHKIRGKLEFEKELEALDQSNIIGTGKRSTKSSEHGHSPVSAEEDGSGSDALGDSFPRQRQPYAYLNSVGDPETDEETQ